ncbi:amino acid adenylation domain-containing protein [Dictyobacter kobayashii]|uniref:Non-ribosomal peptide synthetase n=1 Tax=Dictyobacter kobayashii TaxID=2014872 RepID=A0A402AVJ8_9CHLR|nr:non-ribosomal peptide synthetase [Dictyobacter kobayashii]GCE23095.1 non-ribosomal peptide synthetase [Dictyobacter kobayashii]
MSEKEQIKNIEAVYPLSPMQQGMLFHSIAAPDTGEYVVQWSCLLPGTLQVHAFEQAWQEVVHRHTILRTAFVWENLAQPLQIVGQQASVHVDIQDWRFWPQELQDERLETFLREDQARGFELTHAPLFRLLLIRRNEEHFQFIWSFHHILLDGWSWPILLKEIFSLYEAYCTQQTLQLPVPRPYQKYIAWLQQQDMAEAENFWRQKLQGFSAATPFAVDTPATPEQEQKKYAVYTTLLGKHVSSRLPTFARQQHVTANTVVQGAWSILLRRYSGHNDIVFGATVSGRPIEIDDVDTMVGLFINTLPVRTHVRDELTCQAWLQELQLQQIETRQYEYTPLTQIQKWSEIPGNLPLFESLLVFENYPVDTELREQGQKLQIQQVDFLERTSYPLSVVVQPGKEQILLQFIYDCARFDEPGIQQMGRHFENILVNMVANPARKLQSLALLNEQELIQQLVSWNSTTTDYPRQRCVHDLFEQWAARTPQQIAITHGEQRITYQELNARANQLAAYLQAEGIGVETLVGIFMERSIEMIIGILGILKAGAGYVPLDLSYPLERLTFMLEDTQAPLLLTREGLLQDLPTYTGKIVCFDRDRALLEQQPDQNVSSASRADTLAYVIYTSGSTGRPKGVCVTHQAIVRTVVNTNYLTIQPEDILAHVSNVSFDAATFEIWGALLNGAGLVVVDKDIVLSPFAFAHLLTWQKVSILFLTTALFNQMVQTIPHIFQTLRAVLFGGEATDTQWVREALEKGKPEQLLNVYGPTECTTYATWHLIEHTPALEEKIPIGKALANTQTYILDPQLQPVPLGVAGELYLGGEGLARGYLHRPELTAEKFVPNPWSQQPGTRLYRTGDQVRYRQDGSIEFLGRFDSQIKLRGFRIELGEIETALRLQPYVADCTVMVREDAPGEKRLVAYVVPQQPYVLEGQHEGTQIIAEIRQSLLEHLPEYMVPATFVLLAALPLTPNGKVDRRALPVPDWSNRTTNGEQYAAPRNEEEQQLADIWCKVLRCQQVGIHDNFFELGGDSIVSLQIIASATQAGLALSPKDIFQHPTIAELALVIGRTRQQNAEQGLVEGLVPLTPIQHWFFAQNWPNPQHFNQAQLWQVPGLLTSELIEKALLCLIRHHDALRLRFSQQANGSWLQVNADMQHITSLVESVELAHIPEEQQQTLMQTAINAAHTSFDLARGPLIKAVHFHLGDHVPGRLLLVIHHLVVDVVSWRILQEDLEQICQQLLRGEAINLPAKTSAFQQWSKQLEQYVQTPALQSEMKYWEQIQEQSVLPVDQVAGANTVDSTRVYKTGLDLAETQALLHDLPAHYHTQINDVLLTALMLAFADWGKLSSLVIDLEGHGREEIGGDLNLSRSVGWFTTLFPIRLLLPETQDPGQVLQSIKEQLRSIPQHGLGYSLLRYLGTEENQQRLTTVLQPQVSFNYLGQLDAGRQLEATAPSSRLLQAAHEASGIPQDLQGVRVHLLDISAHITEQRLWMSWEYSGNNYEQETIARLAQSYLQALRALIAQSRSSQAQYFTPTDFPLATLTQTQLDRMQQRQQEIEQIYALSPLQQGLLFHALYTQQSGMYMVQEAFKLAGRLDLKAFTHAWQTLLERHTILRTAFAWEELDEPVQIVYTHSTPPITYLDWQMKTEEQQQQQFAQFLRADYQQDFDLQHAPLLRLAVMQLTEDSYYFVQSFHHLLLDGWSLSLLKQEFFACYTAYLGDKEPVLQPIRPYQEYIAWFKQQDMALAERYWRKQLAGFTAPTPLNSVPVIPAQADEPMYSDYDIALPIQLTQRLQQFARQHHCTLNTCFQGAWALLLSRYSREQDVVFGITVSGRPAALQGVEEMLGLFINTLPVRVQVSPHTEVVPWLKELQSQQLERGQYDFSPLLQVQGWSDIDRGSALFESLLVYENYPRLATPEQNNETGQPAFHVLETIRTMQQTNYPLTVVVMPEGDQAHTMRFVYDQTRFDQPTIQNIGKHVQTILEGMISENAPLARIPLLGEQERQQLVHNWQQEAVAYDKQRCIFTLIEEQAQQRPAALALQSPEGKLTYAQLNAQSNQLAHYLRRIGVGQEVLVGLCMERSKELVVAELAVLKAGGAYVPLDPVHPPARLNGMLQEIQAPIVLTQKHLLPIVKQATTGINGKLLAIDGPAQPWLQESSENLAVNTTPQNLSYVIYTSGSTGQPKGVQLMHAGLLNLISWYTRNFQLTANDRTSVMAGVGFDAHIWETWPALAVGACLIIPEEEVRFSAEQLQSWLLEQELTVCFVSTVIAEQLLSLTWPAESTLRMVTTGGDRLRSYPPTHVPFLFSNNYGPTENTVAATGTIVPCLDETEAVGNPTIGRPNDNIHVYILDGDMQPMPGGLVGEIYLAGDSLARGYLHHPALTAEKFVPHPFSAKPGARLYRTGDLAYYRTDGQLEFIGRNDQQIKLRGYRIEIGEIESCLLQHEQVAAGAVMIREDAGREACLVAYLIPKEGGQVHVDNVRLYLQQRLPAYMVPAAFVLLDELPVNVNGKIDYRALPRPEFVEQSRAEQIVAPRDQLEQKLVQIWEEVLQVHPLGITDNFFAVGGHSLLAIRLIEQMQTALGQKLPLTTLFQGATIEQVAAHVRAPHQSKGTQPPKALLPIQTQGNARPFFCVHPGSGNVLNYHNLAHYLGAQQPFYALQDISLHQDHRSELSIEETAKSYLQEIQSLQPAGPYALGGYSFGGLIAYEMAVQLQQQGEEVALLAILDGGTPEVLTASLGDDEAMYIAVVAAELTRYSARQSAQELYTMLCPLDRQAQLAYVLQLMRQAELDLPDESIAWIDRHIHVFKARVQAARHYHARAYRGGKVTLFRSSEEVGGFPHDLGWSTFSSAPVDVHTLPGYHDTLLSEPYVQQLARQLNRCLTEQLHVSAAHV